MPIIWRYLLSQYLKVLCLCTLSFIAVLLTTRLDDIAHFATLGPQGAYILWFVLHQIPYILPIALPISCLLSAILLVQRLSITHEITALRACGMSFLDIFFPILLTAAFLSLANFYIVSEIATQSHLATGLLKSQLRAINPLQLLHNKHILRMRGLYFDTMGASRMGESASDIVFAMPNKNNGRIDVLFAKNLHSTPTTFIGTGVTLVTNLHKEDGEHFDHLVLENMKTMKTSIQDFSQLLQKKVWTLNDDHLHLSLLLVRLREETQRLELGQSAKLSSIELRPIARSINRSYSEIIRRISIALAVFTFTLMGASFGISISRNRSSRRVLIVVCLGAMLLIAHFSAKGIDHFLFAAALLYLLPHLLIILLSFRNIRRLTRGVE